MQQRALHGGAGVVLVCAHSTNTAWRNLFLPVLTHPEFAGVAPYLRYRRNAPAGTLFGQEFSVVGASTEASYMSIQGMTVAYALGDEATGWVESFWKMLVSRLSLPESRILVTCNPGPSNHWLKKLIDRRDPDWHVEKFLLHQNPTLPGRYVDMLSRQYAGVWYRRMILAEWVAAEGAVYEGFDPGSMVVGPREVPRLEPLALGVDYGTQNPTGGVLIAVGDDGVVYAAREWAPPKGRRTDKQLADSLMVFLSRLDEEGLYPRFIYLDPSAASFREELLQRGVPTVRADNDVLNGIATVDAALVSGDLRIVDVCTNLLRELPNYRWDERAAQRGVDKPVKEDDHWVDAFRYAVYSSRHVWRRKSNRIVV